MTTAVKEKKVIHCYSRGHGEKKYDITCPVPDEIVIVTDNEVNEYKDRKKFGMFRVLTKKDGDKRLVWNRMNLSEIDADRTMFDDLIKQGMTPFKVDASGRQSSEMMSEFDPFAEEVVFIPVQALCPG